MSAVFSGMETALTGLSELKLRSRLESGERVLRVFRRWAEAPNHVLTTLLIGNNLVNITASALATDFTERTLRDTPVAGWGIPIAVGAMTMLVLIFGEVLPKTYAKNNGERYLKALWVIAFFHWFFKWWVRKPLVWLTEKLVQVFGGNVDTEGHSVTEEDIEEMVRIGKQDGSIAPEATRLLTGVLELDEKIARVVMVPRADVVALPKDATVDDLLDRLDSAGYSRYPVYDGTIDNVIGVLYVKDLMLAAASKGIANVDMAELIREPMIVPENIGLQRLLVEMKRARVHIVILAGEYGGVEGIVTLEDIVEEVFGPIYDEHDPLAEAIRQEDADRWVVSGITTLSELESELDAEFAEDDDYETIGGLLMKAAGCVPEVGYVHEQDGWRFGVRAADSTRVLDVTLERLHPETHDRGAEDEVAEAVELITGTDEDHEERAAARSDAPVKSGA